MKGGQESHKTLSICEGDDRKAIKHYLYVKGGQEGHKTLSICEGGTGRP